MVAVLGLFGGCASRVYKIDESEKLVGLTRHPVAASSRAYAATVEPGSGQLIVTVRQVAQCRIAEQRIYERPDVPARRMRQRWVTRLSDREVPCQARPAQFVEVAVQVRGQLHPLGRTNGEGRLELASGALPPDAALVVNGQIAAH